MLQLAEEIKKDERVLYELGETQDTVRTHPFDRASLSIALSVISSENEFVEAETPNILTLDNANISQEFIRNITQGTRNSFNKALFETAETVRIRKKQLQNLLKLLQSTQLQAEIQAGQITYATIKPVWGTPLQEYLQGNITPPQEIRHWFADTKRKFPEDRATFEEAAAKWIVEKLIPKSRLEIVAGLDVPIFHKDIESTYAHVRKIKPYVFEDLEATFSNKVITAFILRGDNAAITWRDFIGDARDAKEMEDTKKARILGNPLLIYPDIDKDRIDTNNIFHGSRLNDIGNPYQEIIDDIKSLTDKTIQMLAALS